MKDIIFYKAMPLLAMIFLSFITLFKSVIFLVISLFLILPYLIHRFSIITKNKYFSLFFFLVLLGSIFDLFGTQNGIGGTINFIVAVGLTIFCVENVNYSRYMVLALCLYTLYFVYTSIFVLDINPNAQVNTFKCFYLPETQNLFDFTKYDYVIDAVDTVTAKLQLIVQAKNAETKIISCMGTGNKLNPTLFEICDISKTQVCPLARVMRQECKKRKITDVKVLFSREKPINPAYNRDSEKKGNAFAPASCAFVPSVAGLMIAAEVIKDLTKC